MNLSAPWLLLGLAAAIIPIALHLHGRRKAPTVPFAALEFLLASDKRLAKRLVVRERALLTLRVLIICAIALVLSRPYAQCKSDGPAVTRGPQATVIIIDDSVRSAYRLEGSSLLSQSVSTGLDILRQLGPEAEVAIIPLSSPRRGQLSRDHVALKDDLKSLSSNNRFHRLGPALTQANQLLSASSSERKAVIFLGRQVDPAEAIDPSHYRHPFTQFDPSKGVALANLAAVNVVAKADTSIGSRGLRLDAAIRNYGEEDQLVPLRLFVDGSLAAEADVEVPAVDTAHAQFSLNLESTKRLAEIELRLVDPAFTPDNTFYLVSDARDDIRVLLVNGDPRTVRHEDELYFLETALRPGDRGESGMTVQSLRADRLDASHLLKQDVVVLANVRALERPLALALSQWVKSGGGVFIAMGDQVVARDYNATMQALLPQRLQSAFDTKSGRELLSQTALHIDKVELEHPIFSIFKQADPSLRAAAFFKVYLLDPTTELDSRRVLARFDSGAVALVESKLGRGRVLLFTATIDRGWTDFPIHPGYLPFIESSLRHLAAKPVTEEQARYFVGHTVSIPLQKGDRRIEVAGPRKRTVLEGDKVVNRRFTRFDATDEPGVYLVTGVDDRDQKRERPDLAFALNINPRASDFSLTAPLPTPSNPRPTTMNEPESRWKAIELWHALAALLLAALLVEAVLSAWRKRSALN